MKIWSYYYPIGNWRQV